MAEILYAPDRERVVTTNAWAFLHWLRVVHGVDLDGWAALQRWSAEQAQAFRTAMVVFAGVEGRLTQPGARLLADLLLHADLRPDDVVLVAGPHLPWLPARQWGTIVIQTGSADLPAAAAEARATVLVAPAQTLAAAAFLRPRQRPDLGRLRTIIATGGPLSPEGRRHIYTWVKADIMLLARTGDTFWGNPLEPVLARPPATPAFLTPPASARALR